ncbi:hypothetical protein GUITHDRAFT_156794 [Guillardia theta CCMP2712]|uniref:Uncharacterized protein n=1 Tax=Guillardia theta (strain CCMP2712) TaxID=905079 RepID=L1K1E9_GUITC|nr:hypothetical protein GUITHDRAFT_156794 [Guillardia theta CCMP2712]EKX54676.1 hypothetical protein GUITHDRAFT_156794 [Guillardia theta CCMP2712]|eukprot:XP_005841656.1 hypothetical protein GUITHDRAFT_156794 [Guillardia theta CCMP2712]
MSDAQRRIMDIEVEMARTQKNKATMSHLCALKARLAALKRQVIEQQNKKSGGPGEGFEVRATGDARVGFIGFPSVGKSTLLTALTGVYSEAADYEFTTLTCVPGVMTHDGARIQILDLPGIIEGAKDGKGRGRQVIGCARTCDLILLVLDATKPVTHKILIEKELHGFGIRLNQKPPEIYFKKRDRGGLNFQALVKQSVLNKDLVATILREYKITHAEIILRQDCTEDQLIDVIEGNRVYIPCLHVFNKIDKVSRQEMEIFASKLPHFLPISGALGWNIDVLKNKIWEYMHLTRIYTKPKGDMPDFTQPVILRNYKTSVKDFCRRIHKRLMDEFKHALVWGSSAKHFPQIVGSGHMLEDEDVIQVVKRI